MNKMGEMRCDVRAMEHCEERRVNALVEGEHEVKQTNVKVAMIGALARRPIYVTTRR